MAASSHSNGPLLGRIYVHPLKSGGGNLAQTAFVASEGILGDRRYLATTPDGVHVTARSHPRMVLIRSEISDEGVRMAAPGMPDLVIRTADIVPEPGTPALRAVTASPRVAGESVADGAAANTGSATVTVWKDTFHAWDCGDEAAAWISAFHGEPMRVRFLGDSQRKLRWDKTRRVTFADAAPLLALTQGSVEYLAGRAGIEMTERRFRPNLYISGTEAFAEDRWRIIRIGQVDFRVLDGCARCELTTVDPETGIKHPDTEPLETLKQFREIDTGVYFGMNLMPLNEGSVSVGDKVEVLETRRPTFFPARHEDGTYTKGAVASAIAERRSAAPVWDNETAAIVCTAVQIESPSTKTFHFRRKDRAHFSYHAGQYLKLVLELGGEEARRCYSLSTAPVWRPDAEQTFAISVKKVGGLVSNWLHDNVVPGTELRAEGIAGRFTLDNAPWESYLFLVAGSGITPVMSMLRWIARNDIPADVVLHYSARSREELAFAGEIETLRERLGDSLRVRYAITGPENLPVSFSHHPGRIDYAELLSTCDDLRDRKIFACGPTDYRHHVAELLSAAGCKLEHRFYEEVFVEGEDPVLPANVVLAPGIVDFSLSGKRADSDGATSILRLAEHAGIKVPYSCRAGDCGTCVVKLASGKTKSFTATSLSPEKQAEGLILACAHFPDGDVELVI